MKNKIEGINKSVGSIIAFLFLFAVVLGIIWLIKILVLAIGGA